MTNTTERWGVWAVGMEAWGCNQIGESRTTVDDRDDVAVFTSYEKAEAAANRRRGEYEPRELPKGPPRMRFTPEELELLARALDMLEVQAREDSRDSRGRLIPAAAAKHATVCALIDKVYNVSTAAAAHVAMGEG